MALDAVRIDERLDAAIEALNRGDVARARNLAELVLREDSRNQEAGELLAAEASSTGELRRLTILCCDLVGSTELSERQDPERYRTLVSRYRTLTRKIIQERYDGHVVSVKGDGFLSLFGYPIAHENDTLRAVRTGLDLCEAIRHLSGQAQREVGESLDVRVGIHRGLVFVDTDEDDVYGLAANLASRVESIAAPGSVVITETVRRLVEDRFDVVAAPARTVKGVSEPVQPFTVRAERVHPSARPFATPLVGREHEVAALRSAWAGACGDTTPRTAAVLIRGEPGIGKSRLAAAIADAVRDDACPVIELTGSPFHVRAGFHPIQVFLEARCGIAKDMDAAERLARLRDTVRADGEDPEATVPWLAPILGLPPSAGYEAVAAEGRKLSEEIAAAVFRYLVGCFDGRPGMLLVEDLQWLDESTITLLTQMLSDGPGTVLMVLTSRAPAPFAVGTVLEPQPLLPEDRLRIVDALDPDGLTPEIRASLADRSDGIPLYLEELVRGWGPTANPDGPPAGAGVPDALYEPLVARLLSTEGGVTVAGAVATIGREADRTLLAELVDLDSVDLTRELDALTAGTILVATGRRDDEYRFRHELLREVAYELQPPATRRRLHERVAELLVLNAESPEVVDWNLAASHYERADRSEEAATAHAHAADRARRRGALTEARDQLGRSIELITALPGDREQMAHEVALRLRRGFLAMSAEGAGSAEAASDYARCLDLAMSDVRGDEMFSSLISLWAYHLARAELSRARQVLETLRKHLEGSREWFRPANRAGFGMISWFDGDFGEARHILEDARSQLETNRVNAVVDEVWFVPNDPTASIHVHLALARFMRGDTGGAEAALAESVACTESLDFPQGPWSRAYSAWLGSWMATERGDYDGADALAAAVLELATRHGFDSWAMIAVTQQTAIGATKALHTGSADIAMHASGLSGMIGMWEAVELLVLLPYYLTTAGAALAAAGDPAGARSHFDRAIALGDRTGMRFYAAETSRCRAHLATDESAVVSQLQSALGLARAQGARPFELRIALDLHDRLGIAARADLDLALAGFEHGSTSTDLTRARDIVQA